MRRKASRAQRKLPVTLTAITDDQSSKLTSGNAAGDAGVPALLNNRSTRACFAAARYDRHAAH